MRTPWRRVLWQLTIGPFDITLPSQRGHLAIAVLVSASKLADHLDPVRIHEFWAAYRHANQRSALRRGEGAGARARLRASNRLAHQAASRCLASKHIKRCPPDDF